MMNPTTTIIGAGVVNLLTAYKLCKQGHSLTIIDKAPNPFAQSSWKTLGATFGGENVRMYTYTEADNYNEKNNVIYANMHQVFSCQIKDNGWLVKDLEELNYQEKDWINAFDEVTAEEACQFSEDIYFVNKSSEQYWQQLMQDDPQLFEGVDLLQDILRIYSEKEDFETAQTLHNRLESTKKVYSMEETLQNYPLFTHAYNTQQLGGCITVKGFTLKVQDFCQKIIHYLQQQGVEFRWNTTFQEVVKLPSGKIEGVLIDDVLHTADNYVLSLGGYAATALKHTQTDNLLHGVLGVWLTLPNIYPELNQSMKIHKAGHVGEDTNVTIINNGKEDVLVLGSGYGYTGNRAKNSIQLEELSGIFESLKHTAATYFPDAYTQVKNTIDETKKYCIRPFTPNGLGVFEVLEATQGKVIITGGNNTGGFTQAPYIAEAVWATLCDQTHLMQTLFHPQRILQDTSILNK